MQFTLSLFTINPLSFNGLGTVFGYLVGFAAAAVFAKDNTVWQVYAFLGAFFALFSLPTILGAKEIPR